MQRNVKVTLARLRIMLAYFFAVIGHSCDTELILKFGTKLLKTLCLNSQKPLIRYSALSVPLKKGNYEAKKRARRLFFSTVVKKNVEPILAHDYFSKSVQYLRSSSRYVQGCIQRFHGFDMIFWSWWKFLLNLLLLTRVPMNSDGETFCKNTSNNILNNYLTNRSFPNSALTLVWRMSKEDIISSHLMQKDQAEWYKYAENFRCLETIRELEREAGYVGIWKLAQSWRYMLVIMKIVLVLKFRSNLFFKTEPLLGFELWMELKST